MYGTNCSVIGIGGFPSSGFKHRPLKEIRLKEINVKVQFECTDFPVLYMTRIKPVLAVGLLSFS